MTATGAAFPSPSFVRHWRAEAVSGLGTYVTLFALQTLVVLTLEGSAADVGYLNAARWLPFLVLGLVVGAVVDGRRRLPLMIGTDLVQGLLLLVVPLLWWVGRLSLPSLLVVVLAYGTAAVVNAAASGSFLPRLVERPHLQAAHARVDGADAVASTTGPALGGILVALVGAPLAVLVDSLTYLYSALTLRRIDHAEPAPRTGVTARGLLREVHEGLRWIYRGSGLRTLEVSTHVWFVGHAVVGVVLAPYVLRSLDLTAFQFGLVGAAGGVGAVVGAAVTTRLGRAIGTGRTVVLCHGVTTLGVVLLVLAGQAGGGVATLVVVAVGQALYGWAMGASNSHAMSYRQSRTPDRLQARTNISLRSVNRGVIVLVAPLAGAWGNRPTLALAAVVFALVTVWLGASPFRTAVAPR